MSDTTADSTGAATRHTTARLDLLPLDRTILVTRLGTDDFVLTRPLPDGAGGVHFGPEWPADALAAFPAMLERLGGEDHAVLPGNWVAVDRGTREAVGQIGAKGPVDLTGAIEIGYGLNPSAQGRGLGTEMVRAVVADLLAWPAVTAVTARTAVTNLASQRVLAKNGFTRTGTDRDDEDGDLIVWARQR